MATQLVGDFELLDFLASGTVGDVYRARHRESGREVVIKFLQADVASEPDVQRRFVREVSIAEKLNHPNIVRHLDCGLYEDRIFFAMELVECGTLKDVLDRSNRLSWRQAVACAIQICEALEYAHEMGVVHRDLKPSNLFLAENGTLKIGDFGLARDLNRTRLTLEGQTVGTCRYMPPEQIAGEEGLTGATDLYALGCILYEMLVGDTPFTGRSIVEVFEAHLNEEPIPPADLIHDCPEDLSDLVVQLLAKSPFDRPAGAAAVLGTLQNILNSRPTQQKPAGSRKSGQKADGDVATDLEMIDKPNLTQQLYASATTSNRHSPSAVSTWMVAGGVLLLIAAGIALAMLR